MTTADTYSTPGTNRLLTSIPLPERNQFMALLEPIELHASQVLYLPNQPISHVYFPLNSVISLLVLMEKGGAVEVGTVGNEGLVGLPVFLGAESTPGQAMVQVAGDAMRIDRQTFVEQVLEIDGPLYRVLHRYTQALFVEATQGAACNRLHAAEVRLCRWMLMTHDRAGRDSFPLRLEFIAQMLGLDNTSAKLVVTTIENAGLIRYERGSITILDRPGLEVGSCECYKVIRAEFEQAIA
jgi:CRP-like cAMP-binding protein